MSVIKTKNFSRGPLFDGASRELGYLPLGEPTEVQSLKTKSVIFKGFSVELLNFSYAINVQDTFRHNVSGAHVFVTDLTDFLEEGFTDKRGCYYGNAEEGVTYVVTVVKDGYINYVHRFQILSAKTLLFSLNNFPVLVYDSSNIPIASAQISINSPAHSVSGITNAGGLFEGSVQVSEKSTISISKSGFTTYTNEINPYLKISCSQTDQIAVPVIVLN